MKNKKGMTLAEVLIYTALFSLLGMITIYTFMFLNRLYRVQFAKSEEFTRLAKISRDLPVLIQSNPLPDNVNPPYSLVTGSERTAGYVSEVRFWRINRNSFNPLNMNANMFEEWRVGFRSPSPNSQPFNDGFIDIFPRNNPAQRTTFDNIENVEFSIFNSGSIASNGDSLQIVITVFETKYSRRLQTAYIVSNR